MKTRLAILAVVFITLALRMYSIGQKNLWFDEVYSWKISQGTVVEIISETSGDIHPPFYYIVLKFWIKIFSDSIFSMRMLSVVLSILSIFFIFKISKLFLKNDLSVVLVLMLYAVSPLNIYYSQEVRMLNLNLFLCLGSVYYYFTFVNTQKIKSGIFYILYTILALYTHYFAFLILFTQFLLSLFWFISKKKDKKVSIKYLMTFSIINIMYIPWYPVFFDQTRKGQPWRGSQSILQVGNNILDFFKDVFLSPYYSFENSATISFSIFFSFSFLAFLFYSIFKLLNSKSLLTENNNLIALFFIVPFVISIFVSLKQSILMSRYLSIIIPYLFIIIVIFSSKAYKTRWSIVIIVILISVSCYGTYINFNNNFKNNDYRRIISYLEKNINSEDVIIAEPHFMGWVIDYYIKQNESNLKTPLILGWNLNMQLDSLFKMNYINNVWFITDYSAIDKTNYDSLTNLMYNKGYERKVLKTFYIIPAKVNLNYYVKSEN